jgi:hypothetical protein
VVEIAGHKIKFGTLKVPMGAMTLSPVVASLISIG